MEQELKKLIKKNLKLTEDIHEMVKIIKRYVIWQRFFGFLKLLIILVPIILGIIYLPPIFKKAFNQYKQIIDITTNPIESTVNDFKALLSTDDVIKEIEEDMSNNKNNKK